MINDIFAEWTRGLIDFLPTLLLIAIILLTTILVSRHMHNLVRQLSNRTKAPPEISELLGRTASVGVVLIGAVLVLGRLGWSETVLSFVAGLGLAGIVIGFALQDIVKQMASGVLLLMLRPFRVGDHVKISGFEGCVVDVQLRATVLKTLDGIEVLLPNADVYSTPIINMSRYGAISQTITVQVPRSAEIAQIREYLTHTLKNIQGILAEPAPLVLESGLTASTVKLALHIWSAAGGESAVVIKAAVIDAVARALAQQGIDAEIE